MSICAGACASWSEAHLFKKRAIGTECSAAVVHTAAHNVSAARGKAWSASRIFERPPNGFRARERESARAREGGGLARRERHEPEVATVRSEER